MCRFFSLAFFVFPCFKPDFPLHTSSSDINFLLHNEKLFIPRRFSLHLCFRESGRANRRKKNGNDLMKKEKESKAWKWKKRNFTSPFHSYVNYLPHIWFLDERFPPYDERNFFHAWNCVIRAHLQLGLGHVDFAAINKLDDELEIGKGDLRRHDDDRVLARILDEQLLEKRRARR